MYRFRQIEWQPLPSRFRLGICIYYYFVWPPTLRYCFNILGCHSTGFGRVFRFKDLGFKRTKYKGELENFSTRRLCDGGTLVILIFFFPIIARRSSWKAIGKGDEID